MKSRWLSYLLLLFTLLSCSREEITPEKKQPLPFDNLDMALEKRMQELNVPAVSVAIVHGEKLVYAKAFGFADREAGTKADVESLFRTASVSKPITAIAVLTLVQDGKIELDQTVFGADGILGSDYGTPPDSSKKSLITIRHLLNHESGWTNHPSDPTFTDMSVTAEEMIHDVVANWPLTYAPGATSSYLNFGYCVLAEVIEKVTGQTYEAYVREAVLAPCGIHDMWIGGNNRQDRKPDEVVYYHPDHDPYSFNLLRGQGAGGWIASSVSLARFMAHIDRNPQEPDLISSELLSQFYFGFPHWIHFGKVSGTSAIVNRLNDDVSFVVLINTSASGLTSGMNDLVTNEINKITSWPDEDLF